LNLIKGGLITPRAARRRHTPTTGGTAVHERISGAPSTNVRQGAVGGAHTGGTAASGTTMGPNAGAAALDPIRPTVGGDAMGNGQAGDLELNAVDGESGHEVRLVALVPIV